jgi:DNA-binding NtrC family response regulator
MTMDKLLIVDDSLPFLSDVEAVLGGSYDILTASTGAEGMRVLRSEQVTAVLLDLMLPDANGIELLRVIRREIDPLLPVIIVTDHGNVENAVGAMREGAYDFTTKDFNRTLLIEKITRAIEHRRLALRVEALQESLDGSHDHFVFRSAVMRKLDFEISRLASLSFDVLLSGETGVGKDLLAYEIHKRSPRRDKPFIPLTIRTFSESLLESELFGHEKGAFTGADRAKAGKIEAANGGTVYIPEVSSLNETVQLKLLQFLQYKSFSRVGQDPSKPDLHLDVRVIMATNESLEDVVQRGHMRKDFYHRIAGVCVKVPPLCERIDDIEPLAEYFLSKLARGSGTGRYVLAPEVLHAFKRHRWAGNVRELENSLKGAIAYSSQPNLTLECFPRLVELAHHAEPNQCRICLSTTHPILPDYKTAEARFRLAYLEELLTRNDNNFAKAARVAGFTEQGFRRSLTTLRKSSP